MIESAIMATKKQLSELYQLGIKTQSAEKRILTSAETRLNSVNIRLEHLAPMAIMSDDSAKEYQDFILEKGKIEQVIAKAKQNMGIRKTVWKRQ